MGFFELALVLRLGHFADELGFLGVRYSSPGMAPYPMFHSTINGPLLLRSERERNDLSRGLGLTSWDSPQATAARLTDL